jgi:hypothetical protein
VKIPAGENRLTLIGPAPMNGPYHMVRVRCSCGTEKIIYKSNFDYGRSRSCGCLRREATRTHGYTSGGRKSPEYSSWVNIKGRMLSEVHRDYPQYGGRGLKLYEPWDEFENFLADMGPSPGRGYSVERVDVNDGYNPDNCIWATQDVQSKNQRRRKNNTSGFNGVSWDSKRGEWQVTISVDYKSISLGRYDNIEDAVAARKAGDKLYGYNPNHGCETKEI